MTSFVRREGDPRLRPGGHGLNPDEVREDQVSRLVGAIVGVAAEAGYRRATVSRVIGRAGVSRATFYRYFEGRGDLFLEARRRLDQLTERAFRSVAPGTAESDGSGGPVVDLDRASPESAVDVARCLLGVVDSLLGSISEVNGAVEFGLIATPVAGPEAGDLHARIEERWTGRLHSSLAGGLPPGDRGIELARMGLGAALAIIVANPEDETGIDRSEVAWAALLPALGPRGAESAVRAAID